MSERVLTGPLLDFGTSFWSSSLVETEFPGLRGSRFHPSGRYGIGFYAVFMIADVVQVTSKRFDEGSDRGRRLVFRDGLSARPLLLKGLPPRFNTQFQTQVTLRIRPEAAEDVRRALLEWRTIVGGEKAKTHSISLADRVAMMAPSVDCDIFVEEYGKARTCAHSANWYMQEPLEWLRRLTRLDLRDDEQLDQALKEAAPRLKTIEFAGRVASRAALLDDSEDARKVRGQGLFRFGMITHGGLASDGAHNEWPDDITFVGVMEAEPATATRFQRSLRSRLLADPRSLSDWVSFQKKFLPTEAENDVAILRYFANFGRLGHLPASHFILRRFDLSAHPQSMKELRLVGYDTLLLVGQELLELKFLTFEDHVVFFVYYDEDEVKSLIDLMRTVKIDSLHFSPIRGDEVNRIPRPSPQTGEPLCLLSVLRELFQSKGFTVEIEVEGFGPNVSPPFFTDGILTFRARLLKGL